MAHDYDTEDISIDNPHGVFVNATLDFE